MEKEQILSLQSVDDFLTFFKEHIFFDKEKTLFEISWTLRPGVVEKNGRLTCWAEGKSNADFNAVANIIRILNAPDEVVIAQQQSVNPFRQGIGISVTGNKTSYRLYLHSRENNNQKDVYEAWRWGFEETGKFTYSFHYASSIDEVRKPVQLIHASLQPAFEKLFASERFIQMSGYWLRRNGQIIDQVDLSWPWHPPAGTLAGIDLLFNALHIASDDLADLNTFPVRHIAFKAAAHGPAVTFYTSANVARTSPQNEDDLQKSILSSSAAFNKNAEENIFAKLPDLPVQKENKIGDFYNGSIDRWKYILGEKMHYHAGFFKQESLLSDEDMDQALDDAVISLYPFIPAGGTLYDIGCGWGGPLAMIVRDLQCRAVGLTPSLTQLTYVSSLGLHARLGDAENTLPPGRFDCILLLESFSHIVEKERLLRVLKLFTNRLVMRVNCQDHAPQSTAFGGSMHMISSEDLRKMLVNAGWNTMHWQDVRGQSVPSVKVWNRRLQTLPHTNDPHVETLRAWSARVLEDEAKWGRNNPLIELMAVS